MSQLGSLIVAELEQKKATELHKAHEKMLREVAEQLGIIPENAYVKIAFYSREEFCRELDRPTVSSDELFTRLAMKMHQRFRSHGTAKLPESIEAGCIQLLGERISVQDIQDKVS